ncbi:MAG: hypothetical protein QOE98_300, partial [Gaiellaceae bacterium]|nr:hypothetical protein [Gaiellaceae bacterium]
WHGKTERQHAQQYPLHPHSRHTASNRQVAKGHTPLYRLKSAINESISKMTLAAISEVACPGPS